ncbi:HTR-like protein [Halogeometricum pallidum JCM 14848]|uniref:histidine kinase n=1 Tax=Halogeometricum pallidum JCM 14848 TaxID=1227487 RepID=M0D7F9_HALPD|nr:PAS domain-containing sensor histidine kinase [Halogeometricum pallidum]ELZ31430.1 HTR-like protein [Halogeometricum pallidum JCM 14848]
MVQLRGAVQDITDHKHHEERLRKTSSRLEALYENSPDMIDVLDPDGTILDVNSRFCEELGYEKDDVIGRPIWQIDRMAEPADVQALLANFTAGERRKFEGRYERTNGSTFPVEVHLLRLELHEQDRFLAISRDITARKQREQALQRQNDQLEEFASVVSHDLRNPLNVAEGYLELLREECDSEQLESVDRALARMDTLIEDLLTLAQQGDRICETESVTLAELSAQCWRNVETADATIRTPVDGTIQADRSRLTQLLENLYRNAVEHGGTEVTVTVGRLDDGFYVEDDGPGISEDDREDIFDAGYSTSTEGTGFGLSIIKEVVDGHGWSIRVADGTEGGARFEITGVEFVD